MFSALLANRSPYRKLLVLVGFALFFVVMFTMLGGLLAGVLFNIHPLTNPSALNDLKNPAVINTMKLMQVFSALGLFVVPVITAAFLFDTRPVTWLKLNRTPKPIQFFLVILTVFLSAPLANLMMEWNQQLSLPGFLTDIENWMRQSEQRAAELTKLFLETQTYSGLLFNLFMVALLPAIGEELLFRGGVQRLLGELLKNKHAAIILSAVVFSAMHLQFYGFLPRMMLGIYFGYLLWWSGSLWLPIIGHFINNATAVTLAFLHQKNQLPFNPDTVGTQQGEEVMLFTAFILTAGCIWMNYKKRIEDNEHLTESNSLTP